MENLKMKNKCCLKSRKNAIIASIVATSVYLKNFEVHNPE